MARRITCAAALLALTGCMPESGSGYVEIKLNPAGARPPVLYLDGDKLAAPKGGVAVLRQPVGTAKLQVEADGAKVLLCSVAVKQNRITTVTVSALDRPPRCQCARIGGSEGNRVCIG